jgi:hypothetical protein
MSLVHEALQKAEREKQRKTGVAPTAPHKISPPTTPPYSPTESRSIETPATVSVAGTFAAGQPAAADAPAKKQSSFLTVLLLSVAVVAIVAIVFLASLATSAIRDSRRVVGDGSTATAPVTPAATAPASQPAAAAPSATATPPAPATTESAAPQPQQPPVPSPDPRYKISGITKDTDGKYWAIINGQLRSEDQYIDGAIVKSVERDRATLDVNGQTIVLRLF